MPDIDLAEAAFDWLISDPTFVEMVAEGYIGTDALPTATLAEKVAAAWLFQGLDDEGRPFRDPEGTGRSAVVLSARSDWSAPNRHNTAEFPLLQILIYVDSSRGVDGMETAKDALVKAKHIARRIDRRFHLVANTQAGQKWGSLHVHSSLRTGLRDIREVPGTQAMTVRVEMKYETVTD